MNQENRRDITPAKCCGDLREGRSPEGGPPHDDHDIWCESFDPLDGPFPGPWIEGIQAVMGWDFRGSQAGILVGFAGVQPSRILALKSNDLNLVFTLESARQEGGVLGDTASIWVDGPENYDLQVQVSTS